MPGTRDIKLLIAKREALLLVPAVWFLALSKMLFTVFTMFAAHDDSCALLAVALAVPSTLAGSGAAEEDGVTKSDA